MSPAEDSGEGGDPVVVPEFELLRQVGGGSYGVVWLARGATGVLRAVKVLRRRSFGDDPKPFEREFEGLRRFEGVSRQHQNLVDVLHVGRSDDFLYYVMELADDEDGAAAAPDPASYRPDTLQGRIARAGRLSYVDCLAVAGQVAAGLAHLHRSGLVHRDVKPGNIVFVGGVAKLADVGLIAQAESTLSIVGTEGYIPPEGPGTPAADVYALGKILYEMSSGRDRMDFPALGRNVLDAPGRRRWAEFNEVVLKAGEGDAACRYRDAGQVAADLGRLGAGESLVRRRRARSVTRWVAIGVLAAAVVVALGVAGIAVERMWDRHFGPPRFGEPVILAVDGGVLHSNRALGRAWDVSPDGGRIVIRPRSGDGLVVWDRESRVGRPVLTGRPEGWRIGTPRWSGDGQLLVVIGHQPPATEGEPHHYGVLVCDPATGSIIRELHRTTERIQGVAVDRANGVVAAISFTGGGLLGGPLDGSTGFEVWDDMGSFASYRLSEFSPDGAWLALHGKTREEPGGKAGLWLVPAGGGESVSVTGGTGGGFEAFPTWSDDGETIYYVHGDDGRGGSGWNLWGVELNAATGRADSRPYPVTAFADSQARHPQYVASTRELVFVRAKEAPVVSVAGSDTGEGGAPLVEGREALLGADGNWVYYVVDSGAESGLYRRPAAAGDSDADRLLDFVPTGFDVSRDGSVLVYAARGEPAGGGGAGGAVYRIGLEPVLAAPELIAPLTGHPDGVTPKLSPDGRSVAWCDGPALFVAGRAGGGPVALARADRWEPWTLSWSPDGRFLVAIAAERSGGFEDRYPVYAVPAGGGVQLDVAPDCRQGYKEGLAFHPSGEWLTFAHYTTAEASDIKRAYLDGRPAEVMIESEDHWEWIGNWHPDGRRYFFLSFPLEGATGPAEHVFDLETGEVSHAESFGGMIWAPQWAAAGGKVLWVRTRAALQLLSMPEE